MSVQENSKFIPLDLFRNEQVARERQADEEFKKFVNRSLKGLFARYNEMEACFLALANRQDILEEQIKLLVETKNP